MNPIRFSLRYPQVTYVLTAAVVVLGSYGLLKMPRREDPKIPFPVGLVMAAYPGATAEQIEQQLVKPVEADLFRFAEVKRAKTVSTARPGNMIIWVQLQDEVKNPDLFWSKLRHDLNELRFTSLPQGVLGPIVDSEFGDVTAMLLAVQGGDHYGYRELKDFLATIEDDLRAIPAVSKIKRLGEQKEQIYVTSTWERLSQYGTNALQIINSLQQKNAVVESGAFETDATRIPLRTTGLYTAEDQIRRQVVGLSPRTGQPIYLGDFANVERRYAEPENLVRVNGTPALLLSLEMHEGNNIVDFGREVHARLDDLRSRLPPDLVITEVADQPRVVRERITHFLRDFGLAVLVVVAITMMLLPLRVAAIAAGAIPVTITATFAVMQTLGIELHQVSLAGLIVCLGLVVDDAIVISDNYVELLDQGLSPEDAAYKAPSQLFGPVLIATLTIVVAFLPMAFLPGDTGKFIWSLPVTIAVAMGCSTVVAMLLTPLMCRAFIKEGVKAQAERSSSRRRRSPLDVMQDVYDWSILRAMGRKRLTMVAAVGVVLAGGALFGLVRQQFFPSAERDQFPIKVWMPAGTSLDGTDAVVQRIEAALAEQPEVVSYASFTGTGAPRFYYNYDPPYPAPNLAEFIVNTTSVEATKALVPRLAAMMPSVAPEAEVIVRELQQGNGLKAPIEVRIAGEDLAVLKELAAEVAAVFDTTPGSRLTRTDYREDIYDVRVAVNDEMASRLGLSNAMIAQSLAGTLLGAPVSTFWEGDRALDILLRVDEDRRSSFDDVRNMILVSPITGARTPLREVVTLEPVWQNSHIIRRNGIRTITVGTDVEDGLLPSQLLKRVTPGVRAIALPPGYRLEWGGEIEGQQESFGPMTVALGVSVGAIFLILLFQFGAMTNVWVVMASIPLSLFGALLGLIVTRNPFGFTAFLGLISLSGVVVRNAIILIEYIEERRAEGVALEEAALEAGKRRLRPIFLTSVSSAVGVLPMILSGSAMWAPLGSVIAMGILCSMVFTLIFVPILYVLTHRKREARARSFAPELSVAHPAATAVILLLLLLGAAPLSGQAVQSLTLEDAMELAQAKSPALQALSQRVLEQEQKSAGMRANYYPQLSTQYNYMTSDAVRSIRIPMGILGDVPELGGLFPSRDIQIEGVSNGLLYGTTTLAQPITQIFKIRQGVGVAMADEDVARAELGRVRGDVAVGVLQLYGGLLIAEQQHEASRARLASAEARTNVAGVATASGNALEVASLEARVSSLQARQSLLEVEMQIDDLQYQLADLLGFPPGTRFELAAPGSERVPLLTLEEYVESALRENPEVLAARATLQKAEHGARAARLEYVPDLGIAVSHLYQSALPFFPKSSFGFGVQLQWNIWDFGKRSSLIHERESQVGQATADLRRIEGKVRGEVEKAFRQVGYASTTLDLAREAASLRVEAQRLRTLQQRAGFTIQAEALGAEAEAQQGGVDVLKAEFGYRLAIAELNQAVGRIQPRS